MSTGSEERPQYATGDDQADANVDYSNRSGYFVRLDVELESFDDKPVEPGHLGWLVLTPDDAEKLASRLTDIASRVRQSNAERPDSSFLPGQLGLNPARSAWTW